jgi:hypothetical protein
VWTIAFWKGAAERAVKTFAQSVLATLGVGATGLVHADWLGAFDVGGMAAVLSVLTSLVTVTTVVATTPAKAVLSGRVDVPPSARD